MDRSAHTDPNRRRDSYHTAPLDSSSAQERRRQSALDAQKQRRTHAIEAARSSFRELDFMEDLSLSGDGSDSDSDAVPTSLPVVIPPLSPGAGPTSPVISRSKRKAFKPKFKAWAKNLLSHPETLDLRHSLPEALEQEWRASVCPKGKRCLAATSTDGTNGNTILYSRVAGRTLCRFKTVLPPDCLLDTIWDSALGTLWILDVMKWRGQYMVNCEAEMRSFFITSKLSELETQPYLPPLPPSSPSAPTSKSSSSRPVLVLPVPTYSTLSPSVLLPVLSSLASPSLTTSSMPAVVFGPTSPPPSSVPFASSPSPPAYSLQTLSIPFRPDGLLLYLKAAHYESGTTPLVAWVPVEAGGEQGRGAEGVGRLKELVERWKRRGGEAAAMEVEEVQMDGS